MAIYDESKECTYHNRKPCVACKDLMFALKWEATGKQAQADKYLDKAVEAERAGQ